MIWKDNEGLVLDNDAEAFKVSKQSETELEVSWKDKAILFSPEKITLKNVDGVLDMTGCMAEMKANKNGLQYTYKGHSYYLDIENGDTMAADGKIHFKTGGIMIMKLRKGE